MYTLIGLSVTGKDATQVALPLEYHLDITANSARADDKVSLPG